MLVSMSLTIAVRLATRLASADGWIRLIIGSFKQALSVSGSDCTALCSA